MFRFPLLNYLTEVVCFFSFIIRVVYLLHATSLFLLIYGDDLTFPLTSCFVKKQLIKRRLTEDWPSTTLKFFWSVHFCQLLGIVVTKHNNSLFVKLKINVMMIPISARYLELTIGEWAEVKDNGIDQLDAIHQG